MGVEIIKVPDVGSTDPVDVIEVSVKAGDVIAAEDTIVVLESDKATVEVPAPKAGTVKKMLVKVGDRIKEGDPLMEMEAASSDAEPSSAKPSSAKETTPEAPVEKDKKPAVGNTDKKATSKQSASEERLISVPDLGDIEQAEIIEISISVGDSLEAEQIVAVLESDKASLEIPAPFAGVVSEILVKKGDKVSTGAALFKATSSAVSSPEATPSSVPSEKSKPAEKTTSSAAATSVPENPVPSNSAAVHAGPAVRKLARELGVDLAQVPATGPKGRILKDDVHAHVKKKLSEPPKASGQGMSIELPVIDFSKFGDVERIELNKIRKVSASHLHRAWLTIPHVTQHDEADITDLESFRQQENKRLAKQGAKLTMLAFMAKACAAALREFPHFNSSLENSGDAVIQKQYINIGVAVETENGLVVPVIRNVDKKGIVDIAIEVAELAEKARNKKLTPHDMQGGSFSISSLGGIGGTAFTPIVNWPEVAILGVSKSQMKPFWNGKEFEPRLMVPLSLSYDHRVIDGADAARFVAYLCNTLSDMRRALL